MKLSFFILLLGHLVIMCRSVDSDYDYKNEAATISIVPTIVNQNKAKSNKLGGLLSTRNRAAGPLLARKTSSATTEVTAIVKSTTESLKEHLDEDYQEEIEETANQDPPTSTTTTTEMPKKLSRGSVIRPFRSNEDLLAALKRRRAQGVTSQTRENSSTTVSVDVVQSKPKGQLNNRSMIGNINEVPRSTSRVRFGSGRSKSSTTNSEENQENPSEDLQVKPKPYRRG